ncbi:MAG TPA: hypothetical protein VGA30_04005 [Actinomycetota bacterium]
MPRPPFYSDGVLWLLIVVPLLVAAGTSALLVWHEMAAANGTRGRGTPTAAGFGRGGRATPVEASTEPALKTFLEPDYWRPLWVRALRIGALALLMAAAAAAIAVVLFTLGRWAGDALRNFVSKG